MFKFDLPIYGLGSLICFLSMILKADTEVEVTTANMDVFKNLEKIFNLDLKKIKFILSNNNIVNNIDVKVISDWGKVYAPYLTNEFINFKGIKIPLNGVRSKKKSMIGLVCYRSVKDIFYLKDAENLRKYPYNKLYPIEEYAEIWMKIKSLDYDVINLDECITLEDKCFLIKEYCDAVVGYEGGMMHLAHCLNVPCLILPSRYGGSGSDIIEPYHVPHRIHLDKRTYFLKDKDEFLSLTYDTFQNLISELHVENLYNNFYLISDTKVLSKDRWSTPDQPYINIDLYDIEKKFISEFYPSLNIGGYSNE